MRQLRITKQVTNRDSSSVDKYLNEISRIGLLTADEEVELAKRIRKGDKQATERLIKANLRFVVSVSKQYQNQGLTLPDLINEGNLGLIKAAQRFDETKGFKFISYAVWWIRQTILQALAEQSRIVRLPQNKIVSLNKINKAFVELEQKFEREPSEYELSDVLEMTPEQVREYMGSSKRALSIDQPINDEEDRCMHDTMENVDMPRPDDDLLYNSLKMEIRRALNQLTEREAKVLEMYFGLNSKHPFTLEEIGKELGLTRERVRQIKDKSIKNLKYHSLKNKMLKSYLG